MVEQTIASGLKSNISVIVNRVVVFDISPEKRREKDEFDAGTRRE